ncbi:hypothetical protein TWF132_009337 [Orbilia oligospora]|nr:hypothetical protein TWF132_009337 [Orbilia oligospora]
MLSTTPSKNSVAPNNETPLEKTGENGMGSCPRAICASTNAHLHDSVDRTVRYHTLISDFKGARLANGTVRKPQINMFASKIKLYKSFLKIHLLDAENNNIPLSKRAKEMYLALQHLRVYVKRLDVPGLPKSV